MMKILDKIPVINNNDKIALLIRHADRNDIPSTEFGNEVMLNEKGVKNAIKYGQELKNTKINKIYTSPIGRCVQTAECIKQGYGKEFQIIETTALGNPGLHIKDGEKAGKYYLKHGFFNMFDAFKKNEVVDEFPTLEMMENGINNFIESNSKEGITIYVTHDALIAFYAFAANIKEYTEDDWVNYLGGVIFKVN